MIKLFDDHLADVSIQRTVLRAAADIDALGA